MQESLTVDLYSVKVCTKKRQDQRQHQQDAGDTRALKNIFSGMVTFLFTIFESTKYAFLDHLRSYENNGEANLFPIG